MSEFIGTPRVAESALVEGERVVMADEVGAFMAEAEPVETAEGEAGAGEALLDEDTSVEVGVDGDGLPVVEDVVYELAVAAATGGREFDGQVLAELFTQGGPIGDVRLTIAIEVLRLGQKLTGDRMLRVLESLGFEGEAMAGRFARAEIAKAGGVLVESTTVLPAGVEP